MIRTALAIHARLGWNAAKLAGLLIPTPRRIQRLRDTARAIDEAWIDLERLDDQRHGRSPLSTYHHPQFERYFPEMRQR